MERAPTGQGCMLRARRRRVSPRCPAGTGTSPELNVPLYDGDWEESTYSAVATRERRAVGHPSLP